MSCFINKIIAIESDQADLKTQINQLENRIRNLETSSPNKVLLHVDYIKFKFYLFYKINFN